MDRVPLILDVDTGIDDALALLYAAASPEAELVAVTCLPGNAALADVARNTRAVLELAGRTDVEVAVGGEAPLRRPLEITPETHGPHGIGYAELPEPSRRVVATRSAPQLIVDEARRRPGELTLVTLGPLSTLARALELGAGPAAAAPPLGLDGRRVPGARQHDAGERVERPLRPRGGAARVRRVAGGDRPRPVDAAGPGARPGRHRAGAASTPITSSRSRGAPARRPTTRSTPTREPGDPERRSVASNPVVRFVADALRFYFEFHARYDGFYGAFIHDPLVVAAALDPSLVTTEAVAVDVDTAGGPGDGQTIADWRAAVGPAPERRPRRRPPTPMRSSSGWSSGSAAWLNDSA